MINRISISYSIGHISYFSIIFLAKRPLSVAILFTAWHLSFLKPFIPGEWFSSGNVTDFGLSYDDIVESPNIPAPIEDQVETPSVPVPADDNVDWHLDLFEDD